MKKNRRFSRLRDSRVGEIEKEHENKTPPPRLLKIHALIFCTPFTASSLLSESLEQDIKNAACIF